MAVPKRKRSKSRRDIMYANHLRYNLTPKGYTKCMFCESPKKMHHICAQCKK